MRRFTISTFNQIKNDDMSEACEVAWRNKKTPTKFRLEYPKEDTKFKIKTLIVQRISEKHM